MRIVAVDKSSRRVRQMFGEIAPRYDLLNHVLSLNVDRYWRWRTTRLAAPDGREPILDVCTGTGDLALAYHRRSGGRARVVATDFCLEMLEIARGKAGRVPAGELTFLAADTQELPFTDDQFQLVAVAFGLRNVADTDRGLQEMVRVCRPGGRVVILEFSMPTRQPLRGLYGWYFRNVLPRIGQWLARNRQEAYHYLPASVGEFSAGEQLTGRMATAGLGEIECRPLTLGIATLYSGRKRVRAAGAAEDPRRPREVQAV
jgi:demethylmenaquinone methyltransferase/2-methoxy-6-polyprenyl-1,4-benzoquinol methylase